MSDSPFIKGEEGFTRKAQLDHITQKKKEKGVGRFWLKAGEKGVIVFLDSNPLFLFEHNLKLDGKFGHYFTCTKELPTGCPICDKGFKPTYTAYFTIIDTRQFTRQDGTVSKNRKVLYPAKGPTIKKMQELIKKYGDIRGKAFEVGRATSEDANCGRDFDFIKDIDLSKVEDTTPIEYEKVLAVSTRDELAAFGIVMSAPKPEGEAAAEQEIASSNLDDLF